MTDKKIAFIGCGNMGKALAKAVYKAGYGKDLLFCDHTEKKAQDIAAELGGRAADLEEIAREGYFIFLAVKPGGLNALFEEITPVLKKRKDRFVLVTMAAGVSIERLQAMCGINCPIIRIMPNTPVAVGQGVVLYCTDFENENDEGLFCNILSKAGLVDRISENQMDAAGALSGCGPAFAYIFAEALADGGVACGLSREKANLYAAEVLLGSAKMLLESGDHPGVLKDRVCSPGGTTIAGVMALEQSAFRSGASNAVIDSYQKTLKLISNHKKQD